MGHCLATPGRGPPSSMTGRTGQVQRAPRRVEGRFSGSLAGIVRGPDGVPVMIDHDNPYAAPASLTTPPALSPPLGWLWWGVAWSVVFAANLVVPLLFGWTVTQQGGRIGMALGTFVLYAW